MTKCKFLFLTLALVFAQSAYPASLIWKVSKDNRHLFIAADRPYTRDSSFVMPPEYMRALESSDVFVVVAKPGQSKSAEADQNRKSMFYPDGQDIWATLDGKTTNRLKQFLKSRYLDQIDIDRFRPGFVVMTISESGYFGLGYTHSIEENMLLQALLSGKRLGRLGSRETRLDYWLGLEQGPYADLINYKLEYFADLPEKIDDMNNALQNGDETTLERIFLDPYRKAYPAAYEYEIVRTVQELLPHLESRLDDEKVEFTLLRVEYLIGKDGILEHLRKNGATVEKL